uniref:monoamine oxidase n=1 Tax=Ascaris lumbricoides TaxID=6252 RepID=A0A9J2Q6P3_ASCLU
MESVSGTQPIRCDVVVIGAGISGLIAAREIRTKCPHLNVKIVEAKNRVGGRTLTTTQLTETINGISEASQWVGLTQTYIIELLRELAIETCQQYDDGTKFIQAGCLDIRPYSALYPSARDFKRYSIWEIIDFLLTYSKIERLIQQIDVSDPYSHPEAISWDRITFAEWIRHNCSTRATIDAYEIYSKVIYAADSKR